MYKGIIEEVFIPGLINEDGEYSGIMEAEYLGFKIRMRELIYSDGHHEILTKSWKFYNKHVIVIEKDTYETASHSKGKNVLIRSIYFDDAGDCIMKITDKSTYMIINMNDESIIEVIE